MQDAIGTSPLDFIQDHVHPREGIARSRLDEGLDGNAVHGEKGAVPVNAGPVRRAAGDDGLDGDIAVKAKDAACRILHSIGILAAVVEQQAGPIGCPGAERAIGDGKAFTDGGDPDVRGADGFHLCRGGCLRLDSARDRAHKQQHSETIGAAPQAAGPGAVQH
ncbi:hypothetical protein [Sphingobium aquiterrae]|uniref:hypothetical protein n=1 Tax=Sphingobium aquiterrae TaxID=2038656 RepID=UPI00301968E0